MWIIIGIVAGVIIGGGIVSVLIAKWFIDIFMWH